VVWVALVMGIWLALACESAVKPRPDATPDAGPDGTADIPSDVPSDADADASWPPQSPDQVDVNSEDSVAFTAYYPYIYYQIVHYDPIEDCHETTVYSYHVKTGERQLVAQYRGSPQREFLSLHEETHSIFWVVNRFYRTGLANPEFRSTYHLMRLSLTTHELSEEPTVRPFYTRNCERNNGLMHLYDYNPRTGWMVLACIYIDEMLQRVDTWKANVYTGELEFIVNGEDRFAFFGDIPYTMETETLTGMTTAWEQREGWIAQVPPFQYEVWDVGREPTLLFQIEYPPNTMSSANPLNKGGWFTYSVLDEARQLLVTLGINLWTMEELAFPLVDYNQFQARQVHPRIPHLWFWRDAGTRLKFMGNVVMPSMATSDIVLWDQELDLQRLVTSGDRLYSVPFLLPGEDPPRTLVYRSSGSHTEGIRLHMRDLIAAGILDETGHLLPEPEGVK